MLNITAYCIYLLLTYTITVHVGWSFYKNGRIYILEELHDEALTDHINRLLLTGYYLLNLGYAALMLKNWEEITTLVQWITSITTIVGRILIGLGLMHYLNMMGIYLLRKYNYFS